MLSVILAGLAMQAAAPAASKPATPAGKADKKVCRRETATGSIMGRSVCRTRAEWAAQDKADNLNGDDFRNRSTNQGLPALGGRGG